MVRPIFVACRASYIGHGHAMPSSPCSRASLRPIPATVVRTTSPLPPSGRRIMLHDVPALAIAVYVLWFHERAWRIICLGVGVEQALH
jgi:hypothetical protein